MRLTSRSAPAACRHPIRLLHALVLAVGLSIIAGPATAQSGSGGGSGGGSGSGSSGDPQLLGTFRDWNAFMMEEPGGRVCWMAGKPKRDEGNYSRRGDIFALITHRPHENSLDVVSFVAGYAHADGSETALQIGNAKFSLFTEQDMAWARDEKTDRAIVQAIRSGSTMVVRGTSSRGTRTTDTYSLSGSSAAYDAINKACGVTAR